MSNICFEPRALYTYIFILLSIIIIFVYVYMQQAKEHMSDVDLISNLSKQELQQKVQDLQQELFNIKISEQKCQGALEATQQLINSGGSGNLTQQKFLNKIYNPLAPPENVYFGGSFTNPGYNAYQDYQQLGFITNNSGQFPVFGRFKYPGKTDRLEYYTINEGRNRIKIPIKTKNFEELYTGDFVTVPELNSENFEFNKYDDESFKYDPNTNTI